MKICMRCGAHCDDSAVYCNNCGAKLPEYGQNGGFGQKNQQSYGPGWNDSGNYGGNPYGGQGPYNAGGNGYDPYGGNYSAGPYANGPYPVRNTAGIKTRNIALCIIFSIFTFGIYGIYWMIKINDEINQLADEPEATSGGMVFLFSVITFGIYSLYWEYRMGERFDKIKGNPGGSSSILYLILSIFGLDIIDYALSQDMINKAVQNRI